jgi:RNA polymerase sigma-B factor
MFAPEALRQHLLWQDVHDRAPNATDSSNWPKPRGGPLKGLTKHREARLFTHLRQTGDPDAREALIRKYLPLARHTARRFQRKNDSADDLYQVACYALVKAVDGFDPARGLVFSSYAIPTISGELKRFARDTGWGLRVPRGLQERVLAVERTIAALTAQSGRSPTPRQIADATGLTREEVLEAIEAGSNHVLESLDMPLGGDPDAFTRLDTVGEVDPGYELIEDADAVGLALRDLPAREQMILSLRFGEELPQSEIARRLGISQMHVSRLLRRTLDDLSKRVEEPALAR